MRKTLADLKPGEKGIIEEINIKGIARRRLQEMGITKGENVEMKKYAPLGDPIEIRIKGYSLCFRKSEAKEILVNNAL